MSNDWITYPALREMGAELLRERISESPAAAAKWVEAAALNGLVNAQIAFGQMLVDGYGRPRDAAAGLRWFKIAAAAGSAEATTMVGRCHELGWGVAVDKAEAARHYAHAAAMGDDWARFNLAGLMLGGDGVPQDRDAALALYLRAARRGHAKSMTLVGRYLEHGWDRPARRAAAMRWYCRGARGGDYRGQFDYGRLLAEDGRREDALDWLARSIAGAVPVFCREVGRGLREHPDPAFRALGLSALARACETGDPADLRAYAAGLAEGLGGAPSPAEAREHFQRARHLEQAQASPPAAPAVPRSRQRLRRRVERLLARLTPWRKHHARADKPQN